MAHIETGGSGKKVNVELNLVPFIDLMSVLITFLLISAVWTQVSMIQIGSSIYGKKIEETPTVASAPNPEIEKVVKLEVRASGYILTIGKELLSVPKSNGQFDDQSLLLQLERAKKMYPQKLDAVIAVADEMSYEVLIRGMDSLLKAGFPEISVATGGPQ